MVPENVIAKGGQLISKNAPLLLTTFAITGTVSTAVLTAKASFEASDILREDAEKNGVIEDKKERITHNAKLVWQLYIPAGISGAATIGAVIFANKIGASKTAAALSAYTLTEKAFGEYKTKVVEEIGKHKEQVIRDDIVRDSVEKNPPENIIVAGSGEVLCCELYTKRYFTSSMEELRKAQNDINMEIVNNLYVSLEEFYDAIKLPYTSHSSDLGWDSDRLMELEFSTVLSEDGRPCLAFSYNYIKPI